MPIHVWPAADRRAFVQAFEPASLLDANPKAANMALTTRISVENSYARWLLWLSQCQPDCFREPPATRTTEKRVVEYLHSIKEELELLTVLGYTCRLRVALEIIAPEEDWNWFTGITQRIEAYVRRQPRKEKAFVPIQELYGHGLELMQAAESDQALEPVKRAELFRNGLIFALLAARPLRRRNMLTLVIGESLLESGEGYRVLIPDMRHYLTQYRPVLAAGEYAQPGCRSLWLARSGDPLPSDTLADAIARHSLKRFGVRLTPHDFRHCAATSITMDNPDEFAIIKVILGHATTRTAERFYDHAKGAQAVQAFQAVVAKRRGSAAFHRL
jgi:integrase